MGLDRGSPAPEGTPQHRVIHPAGTIGSVSDARRFQVVSDLEPAGDQPAAIEALAAGSLEGDQSRPCSGSPAPEDLHHRLGDRAGAAPDAGIAHNKTLAAQLANEFREFFPHNPVEYFVCYYDYYQPEAYMPSSDTYIEKDSSINDEIDRLRHSATAAC